MATIDPQDPALASFWAERHLCTLTTLRANGSPHVVPVGVTWDPDAALARVITRAGSAKVRHVEGDPRVSVCQVDGARWATLEGRARVTDDPAEVAEAVRRYAERYRQPSLNPTRVALVISVQRILGHC